MSYFEESSVFGLFKKLKCEKLCWPKFYDMIQNTKEANVKEANFTKFIPYKGTEHALTIWRTKVDNNIFSRYKGHTSFNLTCETGQEFVIFPTNHTVNISYFCGVAMETPIKHYSLTIEDPLWQEELQKLMGKIFTIQEIYAEGERVQETIYTDMRLEDFITSTQGDLLVCQYTFERTEEQEGN